MNEIDVPIDNDSIIIENDMLQVGAVDVIKLTQTPDVELIFDAGTSV